MDNTILEKASNINKRYQEFIEKCDSCEESKKWDIEQYGQMEMYLANELTCILLRLSAADGHITAEEVELFNAIMGTEYTIDALKAVYAEMEESVRSYSVDGFVADLAGLKEEFTEIIVDYAVIVTGACELLCECDGIVTMDEIAEAKALMAAIGI